MKKMKGWILLSLLVLVVSGCGKAQTGRIDSAEIGMASTLDMGEVSDEEIKPSEETNTEDETKSEEDISETPGDNTEQEEPPQETENAEPTESESGEQEEVPPSDVPPQQETPEVPQEVEPPVEIVPPTKTNAKPSIQPKPNTKWDGFYNISTPAKEHLLIVQTTSKKTFKFTLQTHYYGKNYGKKYIEGIAKINGNSATYRTKTGNCTLTFESKAGSMTIKTNTCSAFKAEEQKGFTFSGTYKYYKTDPRWARTYTFGDKTRGSRITLSNFNGEDVKVSVHSWQKARVPSDYNAYFSEYAKIENIKGPTVKASYYMVPNPCSFYVAIEGKEAYVGSANCVTKSGGRLLENYPYMQAN